MGRDGTVDLPANPAYTVALGTLVSRVNGFVYAGDRLDAVVGAVKELRRDPELAAQLLGEAAREAPPKDLPMSEPPDEFVEYAKAAFEHRQCRDKAHRQLGVPFAADVTTVDPADPDVAAWRCGHGVRYWLVPGVKDGTP